MGFASDDLQRVRGYLVGQAAKLSVAQLVAKLQADTLPLCDLVAAFSAAQFVARPAPDGWSAALICSHILDMSEHGATAVEGILERGALPASVNDARPGEARDHLHHPADFWPAFMARRAPFYARVLQASGEEHLDIKIEHPWFGALNWREWILFMRVHDLDHLRQLQSLAQQLKVPA